MAFLPRTSSHLCVPQHSTCIATLRGLCPWKHLSLCTGARSWLTAYQGFSDGSDASRNASEIIIKKKKFVALFKFKMGLSKISSYAPIVFHSPHHKAIVEVILRTNTIEIQNEVLVMIKSDLSLSHIYISSSLTRLPVLFLVSKQLLNISLRTIIFSYIFM